MVTSKTYVVGAGGLVRRLTNLTNSWVSVPIDNSYITGSAYQLYDVMTDPLNINKVFVVGEGNASTPTKGIYYSTSAGDKWTAASGTYQTNFDPLTLSLKWSEVWVIDQYNIVAAGNNGYVARSVDGGLTFDLCTQLPSVVEVSGDPAVIPNCLSIHWISSTVGVTASKSHVFKTIDGGTTWVVLNGGNALVDGTVQANEITGIHLSSDGNTIVALASNRIFRSTNNGVTWNSVFSFPTDVNNYGKGRHLTWTNDNSMVALGANGMRLYTTNAGATWVVISAYNMFSGDSLAGHMYQAGNGFYSEGNQILRTTDNTVTGVPSDTGYQATAVWTGWQQPTCYELTPCDGGNSIIVSTDLAYADEQVIIVCPENLTSSSGTGNPIPIQGFPLSTQLSTIGDTWYLEPCCNTGERYTVTNNFAGYVGWTIVIPQISPDICFTISFAPGNNQYTALGEVYTRDALVWRTCADCLSMHPCTNLPPIIPECGCYTVSIVLGECNSPIQLTTFPDVIADCVSCNVNKCYVLVDCTDPSNFFNTDVNLSLYLNKVIKLDYDVDTCWRVFEAANCDNKQTVQGIAQVFETCTECLPPPLPENVDLSYRSIYPGYDTPGCSPEYTEKVNCNFASQYYQKMVSERYGINFCCPLDLDKWDVKKSLLDLKVLYNEELCQSSFSKCCPPECVTAEIISFNPITCPAPTNVEVELDYPTLCVPPEDVTIIFDVEPDAYMCDCYDITVGSLNKPTDPPPVATLVPCGWTESVNVTLAFDSTSRFCLNTAPLVATPVGVTVTVSMVSTNCFVNPCPPL